MTRKKILLSIALAITVSCAAPGAAWAQSHLKDLDETRSLLTEIGNKLPDVIKSAKPADIRPLERVFEINNYAMMTIESYLKMLRVATLPGNSLNKETITLVNNWLQFIANYCESDLKYLDEAMAEAGEKSTSDIIGQERDGISRLREAAKKGMIENSKLMAD